MSATSHRSQGRVHALYIYPLKGARAIALERSDVLRCGLRNDRRFALLDAAGTVLTQREEPRLALLETAIEDAQLVLRVAGESARVPLDAGGPTRTVKVWDDEVLAVEVAGEGAALVSELVAAHLGRRCTLVRMPATTIRPVDPPYATAGDHVGFADAFPVLVASLASLADLNARLDEPVGIDRFRPNVVLDGIEPWKEEEATAISIGALHLRMPKKCARCVVTTVDQETGAVTGKEPLRTLGLYRREGNKANFAMNAIPDAEGAIAVGDAVTLS